MGTNLATMTQTMSDSQEAVLEITLTELTREQMLIFTPLSLLFKVEAIYPLGAPGSDG